MSNTVELHAKVKSAPQTPGCYLFYDRFGHIIYVGKSKRLDSRVNSYFQESAKKDERIADLIRVIYDVSYVQTQTELDALIEEYLLIRKHKPIFNSQHIRDYRPRYLHIRTGAFPAASMVDEASEDGQQYLGPFRDEYKVEEAIALLNYAFRIPLCGREQWPKAHRPCLNHELGKCYAPCCGSPGVSVYPFAEELAAFLQNNPAGVVERLSVEMRLAASEHRFEEAQSIKDTLERLRALSRRTEYGFSISPKMHAFLMMRGYGEQEYSLFHIRQGRVERRIRLPAGLLEDELIEAFMKAAEGSQGNRDGDDADSGRMTACLQAISAHKRFAALPAALDEAALVSELRRLYRRFTG